MKIFSLVLILLCVCFVVYLMQPSVQSSIVLECDSRTIVFENVEPDVWTAPKQIKLRNLSDTEVKIKQVRTGCGCARTETRNTVIPAHSEVSIDVKMRLMDGEIKLGKSVPIYVFLEHDNQPSLSFAATVKPNTASSNQSIKLDFGLKERESLPMSLSIPEQASSKIELTDEQESLGFELHVDTSEGSEKLVLNESAPSGELYQSIRVVKGNIVRECLTMGTLKGEVSCIPSMLHVGPILSTDQLSPSRNLKIRHHKGQLEGVEVKQVSRNLRDLLRLEVSNSFDVDGTITIRIVPHESFVWETKQMLGFLILDVRGVGIPSKELCVPIQVEFKSERLRDEV